MRKTSQELSQMYDEAERRVVVGGKYAHYKHPGEKRYMVIGVGLMEDTWEAVVMYKHLETGVCTVRTLENFLEKVASENRETVRFEYVGEE